MKRPYIYSIYLLILPFLLSGCGEESDPTPVDCTLNPIIINLANTTQSSCDTNDGIIEVSALGGTGDLKFSRNGGTSFQEEGIFNNLASGTYFILVRDANECENTLTVMLENVGGVTISIESNINATCDTSVGQIMVSSTISTAQFKLDNGSLQSSGTFDGLAAGKYTVHAVDTSTGCETIVDVQVETGVSYMSTIQNIITTKCAISGCHVNGTGRQVFTDFSVVQANASDIKSRTQSRNMPRNGSLTQEQIDLIACWVDDGALDN